MRVRSLAAESPSSSTDSTATVADESSSSSGRVRTLLFLLAGVGLALYVVRRYVDRPEAVPLGDRADEWLSTEEAKSSGEPATEVVDDDETTVEMAETRSDEEISERAETERAEPGEMAVDDDVADELLEETDGVDEEPDGDRA